MAGKTLRLAAGVRCQELALETLMVTRKTGPQACIVPVNASQFERLLAYMAADHLDKIETDDGAFMVLTKMRYLGFLKMPRSSVMPLKTTQFVATPGFQIHYTTSDPQLLHEWHEMIVALVRKGLFQAMAEGARVGWFPYPDDKKHLQQFVKRFI